jgi:hypothetical protein
MPRYRVELDGKVYVIEGDRPPNEQEARQALGSYQPAKAEAAPEPKAEERSLSGFAGNVMSSGGKFITDTVKGIPGLAKMAGQAAVAHFNPEYKSFLTGQIAQGLPEAASGLADAAKNRYGGTEQIKNTLYTDPVGVASDISTVLMPAKAGLKAGGFTKLAKAVGAVSEATNPMRAMQPVAKAVEYGTAGLVRPMLKPSKGLKLQQDAPLEIERAALTSGAVTERGAKAKQMAAAREADKAAAGATQSVPRERITAMPKSLDSIEDGLSHDSDLAALARVESDAVRSLPDNVNPSALLKKRRHVDRELNKAFRAEERGGAPTGIAQAGQKEMLGNIRGSLREVAPDIRQADDKARRLGMVRSAIGEAGLRAGDVPMGAALLGAGALGAGIPGASVLGAGFGLGRTFPQIPLAIGSVPVRGSAALATPAGRKAALLAALMGRDE